MRKYLLGLFFLLVGVFNITGCVPVAVVAGAGVTYSVTADAVSDSIDRPKEILVEKFIQTIKKDGALVIYSSIAEGSVRAEKGSYKYYFDVKEVNEKITKFTIRARKGYNTIPDKEESIRIYNLFKKSL
ncbi:hypothetical protein [Calditerrivibrio nitroreducens]|uniref:DUF3568 domain-containing protein n=1 Tax=Calditerrivibrio nitroreducens (strain DSM 19672 / NBRC 101217 / Yu37-1) TaxID=768670 RepID=E4THJ0_CALNY|nr:hypothetical protein [Calditerrivibrio nitroreducens]ADR18815.1 hypothetical protein Calni_0904 [Calditerrivibrio nitroreducens DSM 19672]